MNTIEEFKEVLKTFGKFIDFEKKIEEQCDISVHGEVEEPDKQIFVINLYTTRHKYNIKAIERRIGKSYLGCIANSRMPNAGETHTRGNDLADGELNIDTWHEILGDIVSYELVPLFKSKKPQTIEAETFCSQIK